ncbi:hypothetical protein [uncultured Thiodictyon sp.]|uniref:hypothetical protein n=1 Tax=uncultured Thiodictyon sp. TaxID=1846217 RepID=UPI0025D43602|nr:hypothetical protein [uncultured Thiodictyon sp.]
MAPFCNGAIPARDGPPRSSAEARERRQHSSVVSLEKANMAKTDFLPNRDSDLAIAVARAISTLTPDPGAYGLTQEDVAPVTAAGGDFDADLALASKAAAAAKGATTKKNASRRHLEEEFRGLVRRIKAHRGYTKEQGDVLGIEGPRHLVDLTAAKPDLTALDQTAGVVVLSFTKRESDGINLYCKRETDEDWVLLSHVMASPFVDDRPLLHMGTAELRRYTAVYRLKDKQVGAFSDDLVIACAP